MCASVSSFKVAFIQGRGLRNKRARICIRCMPSAEREQSKKDIRGGQRERGQILHCGVGGRKGSSELGSGWKLTEKEFGLVPCGDKSLKIPPCIQPENGREEQHAERRGLFLQGMKRKFVFLKHCLQFLMCKSKKKSCTTTNSVLSKHTGVTKELRFAESLLVLRTYLQRLFYMAGLLSVVLPCGPFVVVVSISFITHVASFEKCFKNNYYNECFMY